MTSTTKPATIITSATTTIMNHHHNHHHHHQPGYGTNPNTTFVQADLSTFRTVVQKLTGAPTDSTTSSSSSAQATTSAAQKLPLTPKNPDFKLHERRQSAKSLELKLQNITNTTSHNIDNDPFSLFRQQQHQQKGFSASPVSHLDHFWAARATLSSGSTGKESHATDEEEQRAIAEKGFYLHQSPLSTPRGVEPALLPLFPLHSPKDKHLEDKDGDS